MFGFKRLYWHLRNEDNRFRWLISRLLFYTGLGRFFTIKCPTYRIRFYPSSLSLTKSLDPAFGIDDEKFLRSILKPNDTVIDVGANIGTLALASSALVGTHGRVIAFEPNPKIYTYLKGNVLLNKCKNITLHNCAVGDRNDDVYISNRKWDDQNRIIPQGGIKISMTTLDKKLESIHRCIKLLKIDVEGYEKFVFMGAKNTLSKCEYIYFEVYEPNYLTMGYTSKELFSYLRDFGFHLFRFSQNGDHIALQAELDTNICTNIVGKRVV
jgi:FkbM family methyltransferase